MTIGVVTTYSLITEEELVEGIISRGEDCEWALLELKGVKETSIAQQDKQVLERGHNLIIPLLILLCPGEVDWW